jgi:D-alanyl-D-alanine dipeptidase
VADLSGSEKSLVFLAGSKDYVELHDGPDFKLDLRYASRNNFVGVDMYGAFRRAYLHRISADKLFAALREVRRTHPQYKFIIFDALRPRSIQSMWWAPPARCTSATLI